MTQIFSCQNEELPIYCHYKLTVIFRSIKISSFSRRSDDLSMDLASSFTSIVSCEAIDGRIDLPVEFAHVVFVKNVDVGGFFTKAVVFVTLVASVRRFHLGKSSLHAVLVSFPEAVFGKRIENSLKIGINIWK